MITEIETLGEYRGTFYFIPSRDKREADGTTTHFPGMKVIWKKNEHQELVYNIIKAADEQVEDLMNQGLLPYDDDVAEKQKQRIIELFQKSLGRWQAWQEGKVREYIPYETKKKMQAQNLLESMDPDVLELAMKMKEDGSHIQVDQENDNPLF